MFSLMAALVFADQNLLAPNLTQAAQSFGFDDTERDIYLGVCERQCLCIIEHMQQKLFTFTYIIEVMGGISLQRWKGSTIEMNAICPL